MATFNHYLLSSALMERLELSETFSTSPAGIQGAGIEVRLLESKFQQNIQPALQLLSHTLLIALEGPIIVNCNSNLETLQKGEAIMMRKKCSVKFELPKDALTPFTTLLISFDEPSLRYALLPFELSPAASDKSFLRIPLNEKIQVFTDSILLYYKSFQVQQNWTSLLQSKLRELIWIFFHTEIKDEATMFFSASNAAAEKVK